MPHRGLRQHLVLMVKEPVAGRVKTRLARQVGVVAATALARRSAAGVIARLGCSRCWQVHLAVGPEAAIASRAWPFRLPRLAQGPGDLGARMQRVMDRLPRGPAVIIGTDIPGIGAAHIRSAFKLLSSQDAVFETRGGRGLLAGRFASTPSRAARFRQRALVDRARPSRYASQSPRHALS